MRTGTALAHRTRLRDPWQRRQHLRAGLGPRMDLDAFADAAQLHPDHVRRLVTLGLIDVEVDAAGHYLLASSALARVARVERLRRDLGVTYAAAGVVLDLLDRIDELERALRAHRR